MAFTIGGGATYQRIYDVPMTGPDFWAQIHWGHVGSREAIGLVLRFAPMVTDYSLTAYGVGAGAFFEERFDRVRLGAIAETDALSITRLKRLESGGGGAIGGPGLGIGAYASCDLVRWGDDGRHAILLLLKANADWHGGVVYGPSAYVGVRF